MDWVIKTNTFIMVLIKRFGKIVMMNYKLLTITFALVVTSGLSTQAWAQSPLLGESGSAIPTNEFSNPSFVPGSGSIFVRQACPANCAIQEWDPITKLMVNQFLPAHTGNGRGLAFDGTDLWYSSVLDPLIHKVAITGGPDITTIPAPAPGLDFVGELDYDFATNTLVVVSESFVRPINQISVINPANGNLLADCTNPTTGLESLAVAVDDGGNTFWSNGGLSQTNLIQYFLPTVPNQGACTPTGNSFNPTSVQISSVDFDIAGSFITDWAFDGVVSDLNGNPLAPPVDFFPTGIIVGGMTTSHVPTVVGGDLLPIDSTALLLAGLQSSAIWMLPVLAGVAGSAFGVLYIKSRRN